MPTVVLVTGCSAGGIGHSLCEEFAERGCKVYASARNVDKIADFGLLSVEKLKLDVTSDEDVKKAVDHILEAEGKIDIVVNNAGAMCPGPLIDVPVDHVKEIFDTNTISALRVAKAVIPAMAKRRSGVIVNIGSIVGETPTPWNGVYSASKAALHSLTEVLSMECKPFDISVLLVAPGATKSHISANAAARFEMPEDSLYTRFLPNILQRINASQKGSPMPTREFARRVVGESLKRRPGRYMTLGGSSDLFRIFKWLPRSWPLWFLWRTYSKKLS